jgi:hypothetical protein
LKNFFLISVFGLFMMVAISGQSLTQLTFVTPALADQKADDMKASELAQTEAEHAQHEADQAQAEATNAAALAVALGTEQAENVSRAAQETADAAAALAQEDARKAEDAMKLALTPHCAAGISSCYSADGSLGIPDLNSLPSAAAGTEAEDGDSESLVSVVKPTHFRTF